MNIAIIFDTLDKSGGFSQSMSSLLHLLKLNEKNNLNFKIFITSENTELNLEKKMLIFLFLKK